MEKRCIYDLKKDELASWLQANGEASYRLEQIRGWLKEGIRSADEMTNISKKLRNKLAASFRFEALKLKDKQESALDETVKYVWELSDGNIIESVFMKYKAGTSVCVSSQAGCRMGCRFCASARAGFGRNLTAGEMLAQIAYIGRERNQRIDHAVVMGIGEPLENYDALLHFLRLCNAPDFFNISFRKLSVSTCGLIPQMLKFAEEHLPVTLAVSLHAPENRLRSRLMPVNKKYPLEDLLEACDYYVQKTGRRITFEYAMFAGINDSRDCADKLASLLEGRLCHVNLIPANDVPGSALRRSSRDTIEKFADILKARHIPVSIRRELGADITAACGQLRRKNSR